MKVIYLEETHVIIGAQLLCARATDMISEFAVAIAQKLTLEEMASVIRPHPSFSGNDHSGHNFVTKRAAVLQTAARKRILLSFICCRLPAMPVSIHLRSWQVPPVPLHGVSILLHGSSPLH